MAGGYLYVLVFLEPIVVVTVLLFSLRKMTERAISIMNLVFALGAFLLTVAVIHGSRWAGSAPRPQSASAHHFIWLFLFALCWLASSVGLFFRKRLAWVGSLIGSGASASFFGACLVGIIAIFLFPNAQINQIKDFGGGGYEFAIIFSLTQFSFLFALSISLVVGLLRMYKEIFVILTDINKGT